MEDKRLRGSRSRDPLDRRMDQWLETGRQFVDGVSGRRPGQRRASQALDSVGRWVGDRIEWLMEDDEAWREPWQEPSAEVRPNGKRPLEAISRRRAAPQQPQPHGGSAASDATEQADSQLSEASDQWPDDETFQVPHWQRGGAGSTSSTPRRALPRSSRRRD